jgi:hypothetical protein
VPGRARVRTMLQAGLDYGEIGRRLDISPGLAYLIATGRPADGSDTPSANPTGSDEVRAWIKRRVLDDEQMRRAGAAQDEQED